MTNGRVFIGGISGQVSKDAIEKEFGKYGKLNSVWVAQNPPGFAFVEYDDGRDAEEAVKSLNGQSVFDGNNIRVEHSRERSDRGRSGGRGGFRGSRGGGGGYGRSEDSGSRGYSGGGYGGQRGGDRGFSGGGGRDGGYGGGSRYGSSNGGGRDRDSRDGGGYGSNFRSRSPHGDANRR